MAEWVNKGNFSRGLAYTQCLRRDFVAEFFAGFGAHIRVRNVSVAILSRNFCGVWRIRNVSVPVAMRMCTECRRQKNAHSPFLNGYNHRMCTLNVYSIAIRATNQHTHISLL